jgi:hypothetical protein
MGGAFVAHIGGRGVHRVLVGKPEGKRSLERPRSRWEDNVEMDIREIGCWIDLARDRDMWRTLVQAVMKLRFSIKCREFLEYLRTG